MSSADRLEVLGRVLEIANSSVDIGERLDNILSVVCSHFQAKRTVLFMQEHVKSRLVKANTWPREPSPTEPVAFEFGKSPVGECALSRAPLSLDTSLKTGYTQLDDLMASGGLATLWPVMDDNRLYGVLLVLLGEDNRLEDEDSRLMQMVARELAGAIRNFRLYFDSRKRIAELNAISDLGRAAVSTIELSQLLNTVASICAKLLGARGGLVEVRSRKDPGNILQAKHGSVPDHCLKGDKCDESCLPTAIVGGNGVGRVDFADRDDVDYQHGLCVPLAFKGEYKGHLCVFDKAIQEKGSARLGFSSEDRNLLSTMASMVSSALENALTFQQVEDLAERNEEMVSALATLFEISAVLMTTVDFDETVQIILQAVTHPAGLNHDRVMLFLLDEEAGLLRAVADKTKEKTWGPTRELTHTLLDVKNAKPWKAALADGLAGLEVALDPERSVLALTALEKRAVEVPDPENDTRVSPGFQKVFGQAPFITVPMFAKGKVVGVMAVSNSRPENLFNDRDRKLMVMLANLGGLSVENSRLYQNLELANRELAHMRNRLLEADKLAALGEIAAGVAHEIRNPLVSIGGFTRRIKKKVAEDSEIRPYLDVIIEEATRLERTLNEMLDFSADTRDNFAEYQLEKIINDALVLLKRELQDNKVQVVKEYGEGLPSVYCDDRQIKHVFFNLVLNAMQAMGKEGGVIRVKTYPLVREGKNLVAGEVSDTGGGIPLEVMHNIFNPFFTTKDSGSGLGLSIVHKIVTRHFGQVEVRSQRNEGATFLVTLPAAEEARAYYLK